ncbi:5,10-methylenetetrahydrofolate reductase [Gottschalkia purinilytica]|uniref:Methylenetetrahydrofolate reductase n=1 Tax=Gottschalkia purinilytica TaxID=1503 RepID=A0A0L0W771_GOTPU|nr:methylenetetrahydrofolate reductase [NAD(P)H] [Gottschalkia purinilytica]KNF07322.1 5,10-methylenetetrahydrofolate reductase [Gottschalkia purinilytica]
MFIKDLYDKKKPIVSFEIFPPKRDYDIDTVYETIQDLRDLNPDYISVTYGAGGVGSSDKTLEIASLVKNKYGIEALAHLTCITSDKVKTKAVIEDLKKHNIENILALRGDIPEGFELEDDRDYSYAKDLIKDIKEIGGFCIGAAAYPEGHIECDKLNDSLIHLKEKVDAGAEFLITQLFFDNDIFYKFLEKAEKHSINVPIVAGVMPILSRSQVEKMIFMCGASLPSRIIKILNKYEGDSESLKKAGIEHAARQIDDLIRNGIDGVHIYTMNQPEIARENVRRIESLKEQLLKQSI